MSSPRHDPYSVFSETDSELIAESVSVCHLLAVDPCMDPASFNYAFVRKLKMNHLRLFRRSVGLDLKRINSSCVLLEEIVKRDLAAEMLNTFGVRFKRIALERILNPGVRFY